ncbi:MAG: cytochrome c [Gemmatimonadota bacterium]
MKRFIVGLALVAGCSSTSQDSGQPARSSDPVPTLGIGRAATLQEIAALDIDVRPDGAGLPEGSGTAVTGRAVYAAHCVSCHGPEGQGTPTGEQLVGGSASEVFVASGTERSGRGGRKTVGSYWPYATTLYDYTNRAMPFDKPGSLTPSEVYAVTAFVLWKNGIIGENDSMNRATLPAVRMPARDKFVPDDRLRFRQVR